MYRVETTDRILFALVEAGRLTDADLADRTQVERELAAVLGDWAARWLP